MKPNNSPKRENDVIPALRRVDYIHYNPMKHGGVMQPVDWPHSTLHGYIECGMVTEDWGGRIEGDTGGFGER